MTTQSADNGATPDGDEQPSGHTEIDALREEIDRLDKQILEAVQRRTEVSRRIGQLRMASGGTRLVHNREMKVIERFSVLGPEGHNLAILLLRLGRGRLGHE
ncbi:chorismate mutase [Hoyosella sp. YIM 151337]|uniref:chorismate mutase n=1 Tax=Hoyosella sp. YIM 151337 TaxID=2992742 RepID=UPI0022368C14|nr:chorismate mutase [Hoyosella sp. YIM 151337]MCW4352090.1 chorismate mutase [Hoyosella sp. YIM 151337]